MGVLLLDAFKGWLACFLCERFLLTGEAAASTMILLAGFAAVMGHNYTPWLGFKGEGNRHFCWGYCSGPQWVWCCFADFCAEFVSFSHGFSGCLAGSLRFAVVVAMRHGAEALFWVCLMMCLVAWWKHVPNIKRILSGTEPRLGQGGKDLNSKEKKE